MLRMQGYDVLDELGGDEVRVLYRGINQRTGESVLLKGPRSTQPAAPLLAALRREHELIRGLAISGVPAVVDFERSTGTLALAFTGGSLLSERLNIERLPLDRCLKIALDLAVTIGELHRRKIAIKNRAPQCVILGNEGQRALGG